MPMNHVKKYRVCAVILGALIAVSQAACSGGQTQTPDAVSTSMPSESAESEDGEREPDQKVGRVQSVTDSVYTVLLGELTERSMPSDPPSGGEPGRPEGEEGDIPERPASQEGEAPDRLDDGNGQPPDKPGDGQGNAPSMGGSQFQAGDETIDITIRESAQITVESLNGELETGALEDIQIGSVIAFTVDGENTALTVEVRNAGNGMGGFGGSAAETNGTATETIDADAELSGGSYSSSGVDENALRIENGATATLSGIEVNKSGGQTSNTENSDFYGMNAGILVRDGATLNLTGAVVNTSAQGGNGVFCYGSGTTLNITDTTIRTTMDNSGGIETAGGGVTNASNLDIETQGNSAAAIRSDRGGGTVSVEGGTYTTGGTGSPSIYSTADITVRDADLTATSSEAVVVEGKNSVTLENCTVVGNMTGTYQNGSENIHNVMLYQSMSGDADMGHSSFTMIGGSLTAQAGDLFYVTNTSCTIELSGVELTLANDVLLTVAGNDGSRGWGKEGGNGGQVTFTAEGRL